MLPVILLFSVGIGIGLSIKRISALVKTNEQVVSLLVYSLLFLIIILTEFDDIIVISIDKIGWKTFFTIASAFAGGILFVWLVFRYFNHFKRSRV